MMGRAGGGGCAEWWADEAFADDMVVFYIGRENQREKKEKAKKPPLTKKPKVLPLIFLYTGLEELTDSEGCFELAVRRRRH